MTDDPADGATEPGTRNPVVLLHGFTQTGRCLGPLAESLARDRAVMLPDLPGHGSAAGMSGLDCPGSADMLASQVQVADWFGYSMGGRVALHVALHHPDAVARLVLLGATAGILDERQRTARAAVDEERARAVLRDGVARFCTEWLAAPMFAALPSWGRFESERMANTADGLAGSLRHAGTGTMDPVWDRLGELAMPVLLLAGGDDAKFTAIAEDMADAIGDNARVATIHGAGHAAHLEAPEAATEVVRDFLGD